MEAVPESQFSEQIGDWHRSSGRKDLPWQVDPTPYRVWVSEIMLQQTQVATVIGYFRGFMESFPNLTSLAEATLDEVLAHWSGLGYYSRARNLHRAALICQDQHGSELPDTLDGLIGLPGIGPSTAGAILSLGFDRRGVILDGNVKRVLARHQAISGWPGKSAISKLLWQTAESLTPAEGSGPFNQGMMDLGATVCLPKNPHCQRCPVSGTCMALAQGNPEDYPGRKPKKPLPVRHTHMLLMRDQDRILLQRRPPSGIWGGLWSLPETETSPKQVASQLATLTHSFTHFKLEITPVEVAYEENRVQESAEQCWVNRSSLNSLGIPAPVRKLLEGLL